jgi:hypothetical protein
MPGLYGVIILADKYHVTIPFWRDEKSVSNVLQKCQNF